MSQRHERIALHPGHSILRRRELARSKFEGIDLRTADDAVARKTRARCVRTIAARGAMSAPSPLGDPAQELSDGSDWLSQVAKHALRFSCRPRGGNIARGGIRR